MKYSAASAVIRVLVVDDHPFVREGLSSVLDRQEGMTVVAALAGGPQAIAFLERSEADVAVVDLRMPDLSGIETIRQIRRLSPGTRVLVLSGFEFEEDIYQSVDAGANGYLTKDMDSVAVVQAIREVFLGGRCFPPAISRRLSERQRRKELSPREKEILELVAKGFTNKEIAALLRLSRFTVRNHLNHLTSKLEVTDRTEAAFIAIQTGLIIVSG